MDIVARRPGGNKRRRGKPPGSKTVPCQINLPIPVLLSPEKRQIKPLFFVLLRKLRALSLPLLRQAVREAGRKSLIDLLKAVAGVVSSDSNHQLHEDRRGTAKLLPLSCLK